MFDITCNRCGVTKFMDEFHKHPTNRMKRTYTCKQCVSADKERQRKNTERETAKRKADPDKYRDKRVQKTYGVSLEFVRALFKRQGSRCPICWQVNFNWHIDHNHETGKVRGVLCNKCNMGIGLFDEDPERLRDAADYLETHDGDGSMVHYGVCEDIFGYLDPYDDENPIPDLVEASE